MPILTRRSALLAAAATAACAATPPTGADDAEAILDHAIARIGGVEAIGRSRVLAWSGHAAIHAGAYARQ